MDEMMYQCRLESDGSVMISWLPDDKKFKVGDRVTLKSDSEPKRWWKVTSKGKGHPRKDIKRPNFGSINDLHR